MKEGESHRWKTSSTAVRWRDKLVGWERKVWVYVWVWGAVWVLQRSIGEEGSVPAGEQQVKGRQKARS